MTWRMFAPICGGAKMIPSTRCARKNSTTGTMSGDVEARELLEDDRVARRLGLLGDAVERLRHAEVLEARGDDADHLAPAPDQAARDGARLEPVLRRSPPRPAARVSGDTSGRLLMTRETVCTETPRLAGDLLDRHPMLARQAGSPSAVRAGCGVPRAGIAYGSVNGTGNDNGPAPGCHSIVRTPTVSRPTACAQRPQPPSPPAHRQERALSRYAIGVDFGSESGRARPRRRRRRHAARHRRLPLQQRRDRRAAAAPGPRRPAAARLGAPGPRGLPAGLPGDRPRRPPRQRRRPGRRHRPRASTSPPARCCPTTADGTPLARPARAPGEPARVGQAVEAPRRPARGGPDQRDRATRLGEGWLPKYGGKISSEWFFSKALQILDEAPDVYAARRPPDRGRRLGRLAADRRRDAQPDAPPATRRCGRSATASRPGLLRGARPAPRGRRRHEDVARHRRHGRPGRRPDRRGGRAGPGCGPAPPSRSPTSTRTSPSRPRPSSSPAGWSRSWAPAPATWSSRPDEHLVPGICGYVEDGILPGLLRLRGRPDLRRRPLRVVRRARGARRATRTRRASAGSTSTSLLQEHAVAPAARRVRPARARLVERQPVRARRRGAGRAAHRGDPRDDGARDLPRPHRGDGLRDAGHHRGLRGQRRAGQRGHRRGRPRRTRAR